MVVLLAGFQLIELSDVEKCLVRRRTISPAYVPRRDETRFP